MCLEFHLSFCYHTDLINETQLFHRYMTVEWGLNSCCCGWIILRGMCVLQQWEVTVVSRLGWCLASVVPSDFLEPIVQALPFVHPSNIRNMRRHVHSYIALAAMGKLK